MLLVVLTRKQKKTPSFKMFSFNLLYTFDKSIIAHFRAKINENGLESNT